MSYAVVITTFSSKEEAEKIVKTLLEEKLAACVQLTEIKSSYWWKGKIENSQEILCLIKTKENLFEKIESRIKELHSYSVPEIIMLRIEKGNEEYLKWIEEVLA